MLKIVSEGLKVVTPAQMQEIDREAILKLGIPSIKLMENAGKKVSKVAREMTDSGSSISICCGGGNNGGDGFVAARYLDKEYKVKVFLFSDKLSKDADRNYKILKKEKVSCIPITNREAFNKCKKEISSANLLIDALIGTGLKGEVRGLLKTVISFINSTDIPVLSVDCPSGLAQDVNLNINNCIKATSTVTMALPKRDLVIYPQAKFAGSVYIVDIGIPTELLTQKKFKTSLISREFVLSLLASPRKPDSHKGDFGHVLVIAGSRNTPGASVLTARGTLRSGAGLVTLAIPESIHSIVATKLTESMTLPLSETEEGSLSLKAEEKILGFIAQKADVVAIGPGISLNEETGNLARNILLRAEKPVVIDADCITHLSKTLNVIKQREFPTVITPHPGEMSRLVRLSPNEINKKRVEVARKFSSQYKVFAVLKGASTVIGSPAGEIFINTTGNSAMSSGGMGDVLTGLIAGYMAQKFSPLQASILSVYIHGLAGDYLKEEIGERGILAGDLVDAVPLVSKKIITRELTDRFFLV